MSYPIAIGVLVDLVQLVIKGVYMSRSYKKVPIFGIADQSEKYDKKKWHRAFRKKTKDIIHQTHFDLDELENTIFPIKEDVSNPWSMSKDGKQYWKPKNIPSSIIEYFKKIMRK